MNEKLNRIFHELNHEYNLHLPPPHDIDYNNKLKNSGGRCIQWRNIRKYQIEINSKSEFHGEEEIRNIMLHELIHAWVYIQWWENKFCPFEGILQEHNTLFQWKLSQLNGIRKCSFIPSEDQIIEKQASDLENLFS